MPIYEYRCSDCGFQEEYLQKVSEPPLTKCPSCGKETFNKLLSAAGFQLKGSGWYVTDFRNKGSSGGKETKAKGAAEGSSSGGETKSETPAVKADSGASGSSDG